MCLTHKGKVLEINGKNALIETKNGKKEVRIEGNVSVGDEVNVFQNLAFK